MQLIGARVVFALAGLSALAGCGGSSGGTLDTALAGTWSGHTDITLTGENPISYASSLQVSVNGGEATITEICSGGAGSLTASGNGDTATWSGSYACPAATVGSCSSVVVTYTAGSLTLSNGTLLAQVEGTATGCGTTVSADISFSGTKAAGQ